MKGKNSLKKIIANNIYMVKLAFNACPSRVIGVFAVTFLSSSFANLYFSIFFVEKIVNYIEINEKFSKVLLFVLISLFLGGIIYVFQSYYSCVIEPVGNQIIYEKLNLYMFSKATEVEIECFENPDFYNKYTKAISQIKGSVTGVLNISSSVLCVVINTCYLIYKAVATDAFIVCLVFFPVISTLVFEVKSDKLKYKRYNDNVVANRKKKYVRRTVYLQEYAKEIRLTNIFNVLKCYFDSAVKEIISNINKYGFKLLTLHIMQSSFGYFLTIGCSICYASVCLLYFKSISAADFIVLISIINSFTQSMVGIAKKMTRFQDYSLYIEDVKSFLEYIPKISENQRGIQPIKGEMTLCMKNVSFSYLGQNKPVLENINLTLKKGEKIALVGQNGSGKTTLIKLLLRLYDVTDGEITLGDNNIKEYCVRSYRNLFATVLQDYKVLAMSVAENIMMDNVCEDDKDKIWMALEKSNMYKRIKKLKNGLDTILTKEFDEDGVVLSGGEIQKIAIARVFVKDCDFVILDEPSSVLDPVAEYKMFESMLKACEEKTAIFVSHRLYSALLADKIYLLENGKIIENGTHKELLKLNGKYAKLFAIQAQNYKD